MFETIWIVLKYSSLLTVRKNHLFLWQILIESLPNVSPMGHGDEESTDSEARTANLAKGASKVLPGTHCADAVSVP